MQEKGLEQKGFLSETLKQLQQETGGGEGLMIAAQQRLGLSYSSTRKLVSEFEKNNNIFNKVGIAGANKIAGVEGEITARGGKFTTSVEKSAADISEAYANGAIEGFKVAFHKGFDKFSKDLAESINDILSGGDGDVEGPEANIVKNQTHSGVDKNNEDSSDVIANAWIAARNKNKKVSNTSNRNMSKPTSKMPNNWK